jgi:dihydrofolate synthase/folylpolyglutamate synthase
VHRRLAARLGQGLHAPLYGPIDHDDVPAMVRLLYDTGGADAAPVLAVGTQTFLRLVRAAIRTGADARPQSP